MSEFTKTRLQPSLHTTDRLTIVCYNVWLWRLHEAGATCSGHAVAVGRGG
jgi:hypothetical protein